LLLVAADGAALRFSERAIALYQEVPRAG